MMKLLNLLTILSVLMIGLAMPSAAYAEEPAAETSCIKKAYGSGYIDAYGIVISDPKQAERIFEQKADALEKTAEEVGLEKFEIDNWDTVIYTQDISPGVPVPGLYSVDVDIYFNFMPAEKAPEFSQALTAKKMTSRLTVSGNKECEEDEG